MRSIATQPFFQYVAYTAPHWPLHAHEEDIAKYKGRFDAGWDALRQQRLEQLVDARASSTAHWKLTDRDPTQPPWTEAEQRQFAPGRCAAWRSTPRRSTAWTRASAASSPALEDTGRLDNTLVIFLADNGACAEDIPRERARSTSSSTS